jgi:hypothetical protein
MMLNPVRREAPLKRGMDREFEKQRFATHMQFDGDVPVVAPRQRPVPAAEKSQEQMLNERFGELMVQVEEGQAFLDRVSQAGQKEKYAQTINADIASKVREMMEIDKKLGR